MLVVQKIETQTQHHGYNNWLLVTMTTLDKLHASVLSHVIKHLSSKEVVTLCCVNHELRDTLFNPYLMFDWMVWNVKPNLLSQVVTNITNTQVRDTCIHIALSFADRDLINDGGSALNLAADKGYDTTVQLLLTAGVDVHVFDDNPLCKAAAHGHSAVVRTLLNAGADVHAKNDCALRYSASYGQLAVVKVLLDAGADVHAVNDSALFYAHKHGHTEVVMVLLDAGADANRINFEIEEMRWSPSPNDMPFTSASDTSYLEYSI